MPPENNSQQPLQQTQYPQQPQYQQYPQQYPPQNQPQYASPQPQYQQYSSQKPTSIRLAVFFAETKQNTPNDCSDRFANRNTIRNTNIYWRHLRAIRNIFAKSSKLFRTAK